MIDTYTNSVTGEAYSAPFRHSVNIDPVARQASHTGVVTRLNVPGVGAVLMDIGKIVTDREGNIYFEAGSHQLYHEDFSSLCAALA